MTSSAKPSPAKAAHDVPSGTDARPAREPASAVPWQFGVRAIAVVTGLTLLVIVDVHGLVFYVAWALIGLALLTEAAATLIYWRRSRGGRGTEVTR